MREVVDLPKREIRPEDSDQFEQPVSALKTMKGTGDNILPLIGEGERYINSEDDTLITKRDGKFHKQTVSDNTIKLEEI